jgi:hypothetical protein
LNLGAVGAKYLGNLILGHIKKEAQLDMSRHAKVEFMDSLQRPMHGYYVEEPFFAGSVWQKVGVRKSHELRVLTPLERLQSSCPIYKRVTDHACGGAEEVLEPMLGRILSLAKFDVEIMKKIGCLEDIAVPFRPQRAVNPSVKDVVELYDDSVDRGRFSCLPRRKETFQGEWRGHKSIVAVLAEVLEEDAVRRKARWWPKASQDAYRNFNDSAFPR